MLHLSHDNKPKPHMNTDKLVERFLRYVSIDTQSSEDQADQCPSTQKQWTLARHLVDELHTLGLEDVEIDPHAYVYATLPSNLDPATEKSTPAIGFIAHLDTSPDLSGTNVRPQIIHNYQGGDIVLDARQDIVTEVHRYPELKAHIGEDLIVTDGHTLLGADDKAGIAEIVTAVEYLLHHPEVKHGTIRIAFNPDEEIGRGAHKFDVDKFRCAWAYTMDGSEAGELEYENFNAASARITIHGRNVHPGYAKDKMVNAALIATQFAQMMPENEVPQLTTGYEGFYHLYDIRGGVEETTLTYIIRDHNRQMFEMRKHVILDLCERINQQYGPATVTIELSDTYYNMLEKLQDKPHIIDIAKRAITQACGHCTVVPIRGGTDGAQLSFKGLPCPNIFAGGLNFHGRHEFVSIQSMQKAVQTIINISRMVAEG